MLSSYSGVIARDKIDSLCLFLLSSAVQQYIVNILLNSTGYNDEARTATREEVYRLLLQG